MFSRCAAAVVCIPWQPPNFGRAAATSADCKALPGQPLPCSTHPLTPPHASPTPPPLSAHANPYPTISRPPGPLCPHLLLQLLDCLLRRHQLLPQALAFAIGCLRLCQGGLQRCLLGLESLLGAFCRLLGRSDLRGRIAVLGAGGRRVGRQARTLAGVTGMKNSRPAHTLHLSLSLVHLLLPPLSLAASTCCLLRSLRTATRCPCPHV